MITWDEVSFPNQPKPLPTKRIRGQRMEFPCAVHSRLNEILLNENSLKKLPSGLLPWEKLDLLDIQGNPWVCDCEMKWVAISLMDDLERMNPSNPGCCPGRSWTSWTFKAIPGFAIAR
ncbi:unnamed protein product [Notodromas monacha]|uniref:Uncharacterized protein n=1 Tax=Notodromas monacha TaxID=399045 RepID=A0A7R9BD75_9CRUS|nr:unnamed protein product [Notodromas monacha]CAG0913153.1 unnamed protein product [Notodromas monacha]